MFRHSNPYFYCSYANLERLGNSLTTQFVAMADNRKMFARRFDSVLTRLQLLTEAEDLHNQRRARTIRRTSEVCVGKMVKPLL